MNSENQTDQTDHADQTDNNETVNTIPDFPVEKWKALGDDDVGILRRMFFQFEHQESFDRWKETPEGKAEIEAADKRHQEWKQAEEEKRIAEKEEDRIAETRRLKRSLTTQLECEIGHALLKDIDPSRPGFDREAHAIFFAWAQGRRQNAILYGDPGTGKSRTMGRKAFNMIPYFADERMSVAWTTGAHFTKTVSAIGSKDNDEARKELQRLSDVHWLFFDDLGSTHFTISRVSHLFNLVNSRYENRVATVFTTNYTMEQIKGMIADAVNEKHKGAGEIEADRIATRMMGIHSDIPAAVFQFKRTEASKAGAEGTKKIKTP